MAGSSLLALIDDIASIMDDVAAMSKTAANKTVAVITDDLAVNAEKFVGASPERELPIVWRVAKGSMINKVILVPLSLLISYFMPPLMIFMLIIGGLYLCYEGSEKLIELFDQDQGSHGDNASTEEQKIWGAIKTDFVLSAEIIVISIGTMADKPILQKAISISIIAILMTVIVYGFVAILIKLDDIGLWLHNKKNMLSGLGDTLMQVTPKIMHSLSWIGMIAMWSVGGAILAHNIPWLHHIEDALLHALSAGFLKTLSSIMIESIIGMMIGFVSVKIHQKFH